jgi:hypothetical protein
MGRVREAILRAPRNLYGQSCILGYGSRTCDCDLEWSRVVEGGLGVPRDEQIITKVTPYG